MVSKNQSIIIDTHIWIWFRTGGKSISEKDKNTIIKAQKNRELYLSSISIWEVAMLQKRGKIALHLPTEKWLEKATSGINIINIDQEIALESVNLPNLEHKDPADRFIIATARINNFKIITEDEKILSYIKQGYIS